jgi:tetratricopeptide (TPR) repeat protein
VLVNQLRSRTILFALAGIASLFAQSAHAQAALPPCVAAKPDAKHTADAPQFYDEPQFTVAGVKDPTETGGHGSDTVRRTTEALTKDTVELSAVATKAPAPEVAPTEVAKANDDASTHHALADAEEKKGNSLLAVQEYQRAAELDPSEPNLFDWASELLLHRAYEPASEVFAKGRRLFPTSVRMAMGLGVAAYALGSYDLAAQKFCEASDVNPGDPNPYIFLGKLQAVNSGLVPGIVERLARFDQTQPHNAEAAYYHAVALWKRREGNPDAPQQVEALLQKAIQENSQLAPAYLQLGILHAEQKDWPAATAALQNCLKADPDSEEAHFRLATAYRMQGNPEKAKAELELYRQIARKNDTKAEQGRREITQFVYSSK